MKWRTRIATILAILMAAFTILACDTGPVQSNIQESVQQGDIQDRVDPASNYCNDTVKNPYGGEMKPKGCE